MNISQVFSRVTRLRPTSHALFAVLWRLTILLLPWQTRWIFEQGMISGFKWEAATVSLYATWILMLLTAICSTVLFWSRWKEVGRSISTNQSISKHGLFGWIMHLREGFKKPTLLEKIRHGLASSLSQTIVASLIVLALFLPTMFSVSPEASLLWWAGIAILGIFFASIWIANIDRKTVLFWFVLSLIPHAILGIVQYFNQDAFGSAIFGMATHHPWIAGTSVVEHGLYRVLRAYGGMPHPNILGGWSAMGLTALPFLISSQKNSFGRIFVSLTGFVFSCALIFSYSRSAWIAAMIGLIATVYWLWKSLDEIDHLRLISFIVVVIASVGVCVGINWDHVTARFHPDQNQLEAWSIASRSRSMAEGMEAFREREISGWGQGTSLVASIVVRSEQLKKYPILILVDPEPAHNVAQVILVEMGMFGLLGILVLFGMVFRFFSRRYHFSILKKHFTIYIPHPFIFVLLALAAFDHYLWTLWAGQSLLMMGLLMGQEESH